MIVVPSTALIPHSPCPQIKQFMLLKESVRGVSFVVFCTCALITVAAFVFVNAGQTYVLIDLLNYPRNRLGDAIGTLAFADELLSVGMTLIWGIASDWVGRRVVFSAGFVLMSIALMAYPQASGAFSTWNSLLTLRLLFALGASAAADMLTVVSGDYAAEGARARVGGIVGTCTGLGALLAAFVLNRMPVFLLPTLGNRAAIQASFWISSVILLMAAILALLFIQPVQDRQNSALALRSRLVMGMKAIRHPLILLAYLSGFVARSDSVVLNIFLTPWISNFYKTNGLCQTEACPEGKRLSSTLLGISHLFTLLGAPVFGVLGDRIGRVQSVLVSASLGAIAHAILFFVTDPRGRYLYAIMLLTGIADIGMIISSMSLVASLCHDKLRGSLSGVYSFFGAIGIIVTGKLGGFLFDALWPTAAFSVVVVSNLVLAVVCLLVLSMKIRMETSPFLQFEGKQVGI